jgi:hypothetical protein
MTRHIAWLCAAIIGIQALSGCRADEGPTSGGPPDVKPMTAQEVARAFRQVTGDQLVIEPFEEELTGIIPRVDYLSIDRIHVDERGNVTSNPISDRLAEKYGEFVIAVYESHVPLYARSGTRDTHGIRWETVIAEVRRGQREYAAADKVYGSNIQLRWYPASGRREITPQWSRLDAALSQIVKNRESG